MRSFWHRAGIVCSIVILFSSLVSAQNLLKNSGFEMGISARIPKFWGTEYYNNTLTAGYSGKAVRIENLTPMMSLAAQEVPLDGKKAKYVSLSAMVKIEGVVMGAEDWNTANLQVLFFDNKGKQLDGWPEIGKWTGTFDWKKFGKNFAVPKGAAKAKVVFGLYNCVGVAYFDEIKLSVIKDSKESDPYNLLENGGFEIWEKWAYGGSNDWGILYENAKEGNGILWIKNKTPVWSFASQSVPLDGSKVKKIELSGYVKANNVVPGVKPWQLARVNIEFKDGKGKRIGGWPIVDQFSGSFDWKPIKQSFDVPPETKRVDVFVGLLECAGEAWFDGLTLKAFDANGSPAKIGAAYATNTKGWHAFKTKDYTNADTPVDLSFLLDAPAGKHGFLTVKDGHFYFEDGSRVRFWGTNVYAPATFPTRIEAEKMAARLARSGCNLVRIHHLDAFWSNPNIFDPNFSDTQHLSAESVDRLDYFISELKKKGIYIFMDLLVDREFKDSDLVADYKNVERGAKITGFYNARIIELQKLYAQELLTHVNPYTGLSYVDDPAIVSAKLINEAMLFYIGTQFNLSKEYLAELDLLFNNWLINKYGSRDKLANAWSDRYGKCDLTEEEDPKKGNVARADIPLRYQRSGGEKNTPLRLADTLKFYEEVQTKYFKEMDSYLKSLGLRVPVSGSNHWVNVAADVKSNATLDYIDRHRYWDHPQFGYGTKVVFEDQSMLKNPADALPNNFAFYRVKDKPFVISEWNCSFPNEYRVEGPLVMAAYANLQDWDGVLQFSFNSSGFVAPMQDNFDISAWPNVWSQWVPAALLFYRGDVAAAQGIIDVNIPEKDLYGPIDEDSPIKGNPLLPLMTKTMIRFDGMGDVGSPGEFETKYHDTGNRTILSDTGELKWDYGKGIFTINTDMTQAAVGFLSGTKIQLKDVTVSSSNKFCSIAVSSLDEAAIGSAAKIRVTAAARIENTGQRYNESRTQLEKVGTAPILIEGVSATVNFKRAPRSIKAFDINGKFVKSVKAAGKGFKIAPADAAFFYEIVF